MRLETLLGTRYPIIQAPMAGSDNPSMVAAVAVPVVAAGGIMDGRGIAAALALGAAGVQMGTAFLVATECPVSANYKKAIREHDADDTTITRVFSGGAARGIRNEFIDENMNAPLLPFPFQNALTKPIRKVANESGRIDYTNLWSGQAGKLARELATSELVERLVGETSAIMKKMRELDLG